MRRAVLVSAVLALAGCEARPQRSAPRPLPAPARARPQLERAPRAAGPETADDEADAPPRRRPKSIVLAQVRDEGAFRVADGFLDRDGVVDYLMVNVAGQEEERLRPDVERVVDELLEEHRARELTWRYRTDADRLDRAFAALRHDGVLVLERLGDCEPCGVEKARARVLAARAQGAVVRGYVFFHELDVEALTDSRQLGLSFGAASADDRADVAVGRKLVTALKKQGFAPSWTGAAHARVVLTGLDWRKRRFTQAP